MEKGAQSATKPRKRDSPSRTWRTRAWPRVPTLYCKNDGATPKLFEGHGMLQKQVDLAHWVGGIPKGEYRHRLVASPLCAQGRVGECLCGDRCAGPEADGHEGADDGERRLAGKVHHDIQIGGQSGG